jgi:hypothetical protein
VVEEKEDGVHVAFGARVYRVRGLAAKSLGSLRVSVKVESNGACHLDSLDLYSAKARAAFAACCRKIFPAGEGELLGELNRLIEELEKVQARRGGGEEKEGAADGRPAMTAEEEAEAVAALESPTLWRDILRDMDLAGPVGEEANKGLVYLVGTSRLLEDPAMSR